MCARMIIKKVQKQFQSNLCFSGVCSLDNRVYCIGGTYGPSGTKYCFRLNESESKWDRIANLQQGRFQAAVASFEGKIWVVGGCDAWNPLRSVEIYDPSDNSWSAGPPLSTPRRGCGLAVRKGNYEVVIYTAMQTIIHHNDPFSQVFHHLF